MPFLILHGWQGSGPDHWQSWLARRLAGRGHRVSYPELPEPDAPRLDRWLEALDTELAREPGGLVVLCHSLGCVLWLQHARLADGAAAERVLLVAPPSPSVELPGVQGFFPLAVEPEDVARAAGSTEIVAADDDPYCPEGALQLYGEPLGVPVRVVERGGHLNTDSGYGPWPEMERWALGSSAEHGAEH
ncbi:MAG TPA: alpha/beta hydrolase [Thermoleophilaceae bacterium]|nr:alpha/beta hydrolase [Thermoleophilaceae bacterium]